MKVGLKVSYPQNSATSWEQSIEEQGIMKDASYSNYSAILMTNYGLFNERMVLKVPLAMWMVPLRFAIKVAY